jgi:hypothetical protein
MIHAFSEAHKHRRQRDEHFTSQVQRLRFLQDHKHGARSIRFDTGQSHDTNQQLVLIWIPSLPSRTAHRTPTQDLVQLPARHSQSCCGIGMARPLQYMDCLEGDRTEITFDL